MIYAISHSFDIFTPAIIGACFILAMGGLLMLISHSCRDVSRDELMPPLSKRG